MTAVPRDLKQQASLIALARMRRMQRALAHASLHHDAPLPGLRHCLGYLTATARITGAPLGPGHRMQVLGVAREEAAVYVVEDLGADDAPIAYRLALRGPRAGHLVPMHAWYERAEDAQEIRGLIAALAARLTPLDALAPEAWMLSTRIVQRRALHLASEACGALPIRKFALQLVVEPVELGFAKRGSDAEWQRGVVDNLQRPASGHVGKTTVTAFLQPQAQLSAAWALPSLGSPHDALALVRVTYCGIPSGEAKDTVILLTASGDDHRARRA